MRPLRRAIPLLLAVLAGLALAAVALAGDEPAIRGSKDKVGPFKGGTTKVTVDGRRSVYVKVISKSDDPATLTIFENRGSPGVDDYSVTWLKRDKDVTHDMQTSGHDFKLKPGKSRLFRARIKPDVFDPDPMCLYPSMDSDEGPNRVYFAVNGDSACV